jgi:hypothetical protein
MKALAWSAAAALALVVVYLGLGGADYTPAEVANPCSPRDWREPKGLQETAEQIVLSALDGAACELHVSREEIVLTFASHASLERFGREHGISQAELEELVRTGFERAVDDAERAGALNSTVAGILREVARRVPLNEVLELLEQLPF